MLSKEGPELKDLGNSQPILCKNRRKCVADENIKGVDQQPRDKEIGTGVSPGLNQLQQQEHCQFSLRWDRVKDGCLSSLILQYRMIELFGPELVLFFNKRGE